MSAFRTSTLKSIFCLSLLSSTTGYAASFSDDFGALGDLSSNYTASEQATNTTVVNVDSQTFSNGSTFALDTANSQVDLFLPGSTAFNQLNLTRSNDTTNHYDLTQGASLTLDASNLDALFFDSIRNPVVFGFAEGIANAGINVIIQPINFSPATRISVRSGGMDLPGGAQTNYAVSANAGAFTLNIDADSYSLTQGATLLIADTLHGLTFDPAEGAIPFFAGQKVFGTADTDFSVDGFSGTGTTAIPEPSTAFALLVGGSLLMHRAKRKAS